MCINFLSSFFCGFVLAYIRSWRLALAMSTIFPCIATMGMVMNKVISKYIRLSRQHVAEGGSLAEEVISTIRTTQAFGTQNALADIYDTHINQSKKADYKAAVMRGGGLAIFFFIIYSAYALAFSFGTTLINEGHGQYIFTGISG
jgi:ATP-binding cassette, subfamily B (MDR/TAP), member 1